jgi:hypothetical protein
MRRSVLAFAAATQLCLLLRATDPAPRNFPIVVTINPEARVSVALAGPMPQAHPGTPVDLPVKVVNLGFVTATLEAELVGRPSRAPRSSFTPSRSRGCRWKPACCTCP